LYLAIFERENVRDSPEITALFFLREDEEIYLSQNSGTAHGMVEVKIIAISKKCWINSGM